MNSTERSLYIVAGVVGAIGLILGLVLLVLISPSAWIGLLIGLTFYGAIGAVIYFGLRAHRTRPISFGPPAASTPFNSVTSSKPNGVVLTVELVESRDRFRVRWVLLFCVQGLVPIGAGALVLLEQGYSDSLGQLLAFIFVGWVLISLLIFPIVTSTTRAAARLLQTKPSRRFLLSDKGLSIPIELVTEPALHLAVEGGKTEVELPWAAIKKWQVSGAMGRARPQHILTIAPSASPYGGVFGRFSILRSPELMRVESELLSCVRQFSNCEMVSSDNG